MFGTGDCNAGSGCWMYLWLAVTNTRVTPLISFWCFYCWFWACLAPFCSVSVVDAEQANGGWVLVILMTRPLLTNNIFDWFIYSVFFFRSILFFTVKITNCNNYLIYIKKLQVLLILWSVLKSLLVLSLRYVATSQFICIAGWLTGYYIVRVFCWRYFRTDSSTLSTLSMLLTILHNTCHKLQVTSFRT